MLCWPPTEAPGAPPGSHFWELAGTQGPWWHSQTFCLPFLQINKGVNSAGNACSGFCPDQTMTSTTFEVRRLQTSQNIFIWTTTRKMYFILHSWGDDHPHVHTNWSLAFLYSSVYHIHTIILKQNYHLVLKSQDKHTAAMQGESSSAHTGQRLPEEVSRAGLGRGLTSASPGGDKALSGGTCKQNHEWVWCQPGVGHATEAWSVGVSCSVSSISEPAVVYFLLLGESRKPLWVICVSSAEPKRRDPHYTWSRRVLMRIWASSPEHSVLKKVTWWKWGSCWWQSMWFSCPPHQQQSCHSGVTFHPLPGSPASSLIPLASCLL